MKQSEAEQVYLKHVERTNAVIRTMGGDHQAINAFITNTYAELSRQNPTFLWFSLGAVVSGTVGKNLHAATLASINTSGQAKSASIIIKAFSTGNQEIFKNILPLFFTYNEIGLEGIELLKNSSIPNPFSDVSIINAVKNYSLLQAQQTRIANELNLPQNNPKVVEQLFLNKNNIKLAHSVAMGITQEEQETVDEIYGQELLDVMLNPTLGWIGHQGKLDEIKILNKPYNFYEYVDNPANLEARLKLAEILFLAIEKGISNGELLIFQSEVQTMADLTLWLANPHTAPHLINEINGAYWGARADAHDIKFKEWVVSFINQDSVQSNDHKDLAINNPIDNDQQNILPSVFSGENEIVKITVDPLKLFLTTNPNYELIAHNLSELLSSGNFNHSPIHPHYGGGTALWSDELPYLRNPTYIAIYNDGEHHYHQPLGEVRGVTFPFMYDKNTSIPLTMPIIDGKGHYDHVSTIETLYKNPDAFNTPSHLHWYNPYWNKAIHQAKVDHMNHYFKSITIDPFMNSIMNAGIISKDIVLADSKSNDKWKLNLRDIVHNDSGEIGLPKGIAGIHKWAISSIELASGKLLEVNSSGNFVCTNCNDYTATHLESAANSMVHHI
jgi:hypothetical protein